MRQRRDPFGRVTYVPKIWRHARPDGCAWCGRPAIKRYPLYQIVVETDGGRSKYASVVKRALEAAA